MASYSLIVKRSVAKDLRSFPKADVAPILARIQSLADDPCPAGCEKLAGQERYRIRQGVYRILYEIHERELVVTVVKVGHRRNMKNGPRAPLLRKSLEPNPISQFIRWLREAEQAEVPLPNAMTLATSSRQGKPSARVVLLKEVDDRGFVFFTNYESRKAQELRENPFASLVFCWLPLSRQVRVEGIVERLGAAESDLYFSGRPRGYQLGAHASPQSEIIRDRPSLEKQFKDLTRKFEGQDVPRPLHWGGYRVVPEVMEFWQEGENRLHDRLRYRRDEAENWVIERLAP